MNHSTSSTGGSAMTIKGQNQLNYGNSDFGRLIKTLKLQIPDRVPVLEFWPQSQSIIEYIIERPLGYKIESAIEGETNSLKIEDAIEFTQRTGMDAIGADFVYWPGQQFKKSSDGNIHYIDGKIKNRDNIKDLEKPEDYNKMLERFEHYVDKAWNTNIGIYPRLSAFFNPTYLAMGLTDFSIALYEDIEFVKYLMDIIFDNQVKVMENICSHKDVRFIQIDDDIAIGSGLIINKYLFHELYYEKMKAFLKIAKDNNVLVAYHTDGKLDDVLPILIDLGINAIHPVEPMSNNIYGIKEKYGDRICLCGNIDLALLSTGNTEEVSVDVKKHLDLLKGGGGYVCGSSSSLYEGIPPENYAALVRTVQKYGIY